jgi:hypothetical protein
LPLVIAGVGAIVGFGALLVNHFRNRL